MHPMLNIAIQAARSASKIILRYIDRIDSINVSEKDKNDLVTDADCMAEQEIINQIQKAYPNHSILAEESGEKTADKDYCWIIDPLDGTKNYVHGFPHFAISIALRCKGRLEIGLIYDPIRNEFFTATRGVGAQLNNRRIRVSQNKELINSLIGTGFRCGDASCLESYLKIFKEIVPKCAGIRRAGAAALDLAYVAAGRLDGFWEAGLKPWDTAAGILMIKEAGGLVSDFQAGENYFESGNVIAGNTAIFKGLVTIIKQTIDK